MPLLVAISHATSAPVMLQLNMYYDNTTKCAGTETPSSIFRTGSCVLAGTVGGVPHYQIVSGSVEQAILFHTCLHSPAVPSSSFLIPDAVQHQWNFGDYDFVLLWTDRLFRNARFSDNERKRVFVYCTNNGNNR